MILVNSPGSDNAYPFLEHAPWNGCTLADLVFPSFLVIMGISIAVALGRRQAEGASRLKVTAHTLWRSIIIFAFGLIISWFAFPHEGLPDLRILGVLQRIAICYLIASTLYLWVGRKGEAVLCAAIILGYFAWLARWGNYTPEGALPPLIDQRLLGLHMQFDTHDPEGLVSTLPALGTTLIGVLSGRWLLASVDEKRKVAALGAAGVILAAAGLLWSRWVPLNKELWTSSFVVYTAGVSLAVLAAFVYAIDMKGYQGWARPLEVLGRNALLAYFASGLFYGVQEFIPARLPDGSMGSVKLWLTAHLFSPWLGPQNAALAYALAYLAVCWLLMTLLYRKKIFLKV